MGSLRGFLDVVNMNKRKEVHQRLEARQILLEVQSATISECMALFGIEHFLKAFKWF